MTSSATDLPWHITGGTPFHAFGGTPEEPTHSTDNYMVKIIQWMRDPNNPLFLKIGSVFAAAAAIIGLGFLTGYPLLVSTVILLPVTFCAMAAWNKIKQNETDAAESAELREQLAAAASQALGTMRETVGGEAAFNLLPVLQLGNRSGRTGYIDFLRSHELAAPVMRGTDIGGRPFISLRLHDNHLPAGDNTSFVITFFQRYTSGGRWTWGSTHNDPIIHETFGALMDSDTHAALRRIIVDRNHPRFNLI